MIIWNGLGFLVVLIPVGLVIAGESIAGKAVWEANPWMEGGVVLSSGVMVGLLGHQLGKGGKTYIDEETGEKIHLKPNHSLFFIPMKYWAFILAGIGILLGVGPT